MKPEAERVEGPQEHVPPTGGSGPAGPVALMPTFASGSGGKGSGFARTSTFPETIRAAAARAPAHRRIGRVRARPWRG